MTMTNAEPLIIVVTPDHSNIVYVGFVTLRCTPEAASAARPVANTIFAKDTPGAVVRFYMTVTEAEALVDYAPKSLLNKRINYQGMGLVLRDGHRNATFDRPSDMGGLAHIRLAADDRKPHTWEIVMPYADPVVFRGLRLATGGQLMPLPPVARQPVYVAYGDSITQGFLASDTLSGYAWQLAEMMGWQLVNLGFGNRTAVPDDARLVTAMKPDVVSILLGVNDCLGNVPVDTFAQNYGAILDTIRAGRPLSRIVVITPLSVPGRWKGTEKLEDYREALRKLAAAQQDSRLLLMEGPALIPSDPNFFADGLHPNDKGFKLMAERLAAEIAKTTAHSSIANGSRLIQKLEAGLTQVVVMYGTSLTHGGCSRTKEWVTQFGDWLNQNYHGKVTLINSGISGGSSSNSNPALSGLDQLQVKVLDHNPDTVFIEFAINDSYLPYGPLTLQQSKDNLNTMIDRILEKNPQAEIILQTMNPV